MKQSILFLFVIFLLALQACEDIIEVKINEKDLDLYAVEAQITTEQNPSVFLYKTLRVNVNEPFQGVSDANVLLADNGQPQKSIILIEDSNKKGLYKVPEGQTFLGETGKTYTLTIQHQGITITGTETLVPVVSIDSIQVRASLKGDKRFLGVYTYGEEPAGKGSYYKWDIYLNGEKMSNAEHLSVASDEHVDGNYVNNFEIFTDFHDPKKKEEERLLKYGYTVQVKQTSISKFVYNYFFQVLNQQQSGGLFSVPPANIVSNLKGSNGKPVLGLFSASDVSSSNIVTIDDRIESGLNE